MPRKRTKGKVVDATGTVLKAVRLEISEKTHYALRQAAAKHEMSMASYARLLVERGLRIKPESGEKEGGK